MSFLQKLRETDGSLRQIFEVLLPGDTAPMIELRYRAISLCCDPLARGALLIGPPGAGKSTLARAIALGRYVHVLSSERAKEFLQTVTLDGPGRIAEKSLPWYVEFSVPGLVESVAAAQLFGYVKGVSGGAREENRGIFAKAAAGSMPKGELPHDGAVATGGVVFLDEIGDLHPDLQPKLLSVLTRAPVWPVGAEGRERDRLVFNGLTLGATWKAAGDDDVIRRDLRARLVDHVLEVPSLNARMGDLEGIARDVIEETKRQYVEWHEHVCNSPVRGLDKERLQRERDRIRGFGLSGEDLAFLRRQDWSIRGELRGLTQVLRQRVLTDRSLEEIAPLSESKVPALDGANLYDALLVAPVMPGTTIVAAVGGYEGMVRQRLAEELQADSEKMARLAKHFGVPLRKFQKQVFELKRASQKTTT